MLQVYFFPSGASSLTDQPWWFATLAVAGLVTSFTSTLMFTALGSFYTRISDPDMGGSYLTLLNTIANMGESTERAACWLTSRAQCVLYMQCTLIPKECCLLRLRALCERFELWRLKLEPVAQEPSCQSWRCFRSWTC